MPQELSSPHCSAANPLETETQVSGSVGQAEEANGKSSTNVVALTGEWLSSLQKRARAIAELAFAEAKLAAVSLSWIVAMAVFAIAFVFIGWGMLAIAMTIGLVNAGVPLWGAALAIAVLHIAGAAVLLWRAWRLSDHLGFSATLDQLQPREQEERLP